jgi:predicted metal-dependent phosphoesterase TrpH
MRHIDLHSHSTVSDGTLSPTELVSHAGGAGVAMLALTDHDDIGGLEALGAAARAQGVVPVNGVEVSVTWGSRTLHVVGLRFDAADATLCAGLARLRAGRVERALRIAAELTRHGIAGSFEGARAQAREEVIGRTHFARFLVERGHAPDMKTVFRKFLTEGRPGYVKHQWAGLGEAVAWITGAGGIAVLAHPGRYDLGKTKMDVLLDEFVEAGGRALEVVCGSHSPEMNRQVARLARQRGLLASCGSDYHGPGQGYVAMGRLPPLPVDTTPVWHDWPEAAGLERGPALATAA